MVPLQHPQRVGPERLGAQADAVDAGLGQDVGLLGVERAGIGLDGPLAAGRQDEPSPDDAGQSLELGGIEPRRRPAADEDRVHLLGAGPGSSPSRARGPPDSGRPDDRRRPARRSRSSRTCGRRTGCGHRPRAATATAARRSPGMSGRITARPRRNGLSGTAAFTVGLDPHRHVINAEEHPWQAPVSRTCTIWSSSIPTSSMSPPSDRRSGPNLLVQDLLDPCQDRLAGRTNPICPFADCCMTKNPELRRATRGRRGRDTTRSRIRIGLTGGRASIVAVTAAAAADRHSRRHRRRRRRDSRRHRRRHSRRHRRRDSRHRHHRRRGSGVVLR